MILRIKKVNYIVQKTEPNKFLIRTQQRIIPLAKREVVNVTYNVDTVNIKIDCGEFL